MVLRLRIAYIPTYVVEIPVQVLCILKPWLHSIKGEIHKTITGQGHVHLPTKIVIPRSLQVTQCATKKKLFISLRESIHLSHSPKPNQGWDQFRNWNWIDSNFNSNSGIGIGIASRGIGIGIARWNWPELKISFQLHQQFLLFHVTFAISNYQ